MKRKLFGFAMSLILCTSSLQVFAQEDTDSNVSGEISVDEFSYDCGIIDTEGPKLISISIDKTEMSIDGFSELIVYAEDDISGISSCEVSFVGRNIYSSFVRNYYYDADGNMVHYPEGELHGIISDKQIGYGLCEGEYSLHGIGIWDYAGNVTCYSVDVRDGFLPLEEKHLFSFTVKEAEHTPSDILPEITKVEVSSTSVVVPGSVDFAVQVDRPEEVHSITLGLAGRRSLSNIKLKKGEDGIFTGTLEFDEYTQDEQYYVGSLRVELNSTLTYEISYDKLYEQFPGTLFSTTGGIEKNDTNPPTINSIKISQSTVNECDMIEVIMEINDDASGFLGGQIGFESSEERSYIYADISESDLENDGKYHVYIPIDKYHKNLTYNIERVYLKDKANNSIGFYSNNPEFPLTESMKEISFKILNEGSDADITIGIHSEKLPEIITNASGEDRIVIDLSTATNENSRQLLSLIQIAKKNVTLVGDGMEIELDGNYVALSNDSTGDNTLVGRTSQLSRTTDLSEADSALFQELNGVDAVLVDTFNLNKVATKADYKVYFDVCMRKEIGEEGLYVYGILKHSSDSQYSFATKLIAENLSVTQDNHIEFTVNTQSDASFNNYSYLITNQPINLDSYDYSNTVDEKYGLYEQNGAWYLFNGTEINTSYTGLYNDANIGWWLVENGRVKTEYSGLYNDANYGWWLIKDGKIDFEYADLYNDANLGWWKIKGGALDYSYTGLYNSPTCGWWLINNGSVAFGYDDLWGDPVYGWWKVNNGAVDFNYTGLYNSPTCGWWLIGGGSVAFGYSDLWGDPTYGWWKVNGGSVDFGYTGLYNSPTCGWWLIGGGCVAFDYTDLWNDPVYSWWKVNGGAVDFGYTGVYESPMYGSWNISGGAVVFD